MKKIFATLVALPMALMSWAQTDNGDWLVGGNFALNTTANTTISTSPMAGYFFLNHFALGGSMKLGYEKTGDNKTTILGFGPFARYYFGNGNLKPFLTTEYLFTSNKFQNPNFRSTVNGGDFLIGPGLAAFVNENVAIETVLGYVNSKVSKQPSDGGLAVRIGFQIYLSPRGIVDTYRGRRE